MIARWLTVAILTAALASTVAAADHPIHGVKLRVARSPDGVERLIFLSNDPSMVLPVGGPDDPVSGSPGGATVELFSASVPQGVSFEAPRDGGDPGWSERPGLDRFRHGHAPDGVSALRRVRLRPAGAIGILGARAGLALSGAEGTVGIRITTGSTRHCARFGPETVVRDQPGVFFAKNATAAGLTDCSDASLAAPSPSPSPAPSPSPSPGVCGDGAIDGETETCDGAALGICGDFGLSCGSPGFSNECDCCSPNGEFVSTVGCCNPSSVAISTPAGGGFCFPLRCDPPFGCGSSSECLDDGQCCGRAGNPCAFTLTEPSIALQPCCAGSECGRADQFFLYCCDSAGTACTDDAECCSSSCNAGGVCDP